MQPSIRSSLHFYGNRQEAFPVKQEFCKLVQKRPKSEVTNNRIENFLLYGKWDEKFTKLVAIQALWMSLVWPWCKLSCKSLFTGLDIISVKKHKTLMIMQIYVNYNSTDSLLKYENDSVSFNFNQQHNKLKSWCHLHSHLL